MSGESFEWAIKKDVRNNPIVREVDSDRHRDMWRSVGISVFLVAVLLFTAWQQFELQLYGYRMEETRKALAEEEVITRRLRLELEVQRSPHLIEQRAKRKLNMARPGPDDYEVIERVIEPPAPPKSVIAQR
jgi:hypothetical protein